MRQLIVRQLGVQAYDDTYAQMRRLSDMRGPATPDELWFLQHPPVYTLGMAGRAEHVLDAGQIPVIKTDRGGQVTYHGPGQLIVYALIDLKRKGLGIKKYVGLLEQAVLDLLHELGRAGRRRAGAPGVYVEDKKLAALGLRVRRGCCYHGLALNVDMELAPFRGINPCGYPGLAVTQLSELGVALTPSEVALRLLPLLTSRLDYDSVDIIAAQSNLINETA